MNEQFRIWSVNIPPFKERIPKGILEQGDKYWDRKYQRQAKKLGVAIGQEESVSCQSQLKIVWQFSNDFTNDTTNDFNSDLSKAN